MLAFFDDWKALRIGEANVNFSSNLFGINF
jgi:hypothetical protein